MELQKELKQYITSKPWLRIAAVVLLALALVTLIAGLAIMYNANRANAAPFYALDSERGTQAYLDVVGVSDWLYRYDDAVYYSVEDAEGYLYTVRLSDRQFSKMASQQEYWTRESNDTPQPEPYRIYGCVIDTTTSIRKNLSDIWDITEEEYTLYFGTKLLDATTSAGEDRASIWFIAAFLCCLIGLALGSSAWSVSRRAKKCLNALEERGILEKAAQQLNAPDTVSFCNGDVHLSQDFLFGKELGVVVPYDEILWAYQKTLRRNFVVANTSLIVNTRKMKNLMAINIGGKDSQGTIVQAMTVIAQHNPKVLLGYTKENIKAFKQLQKEAAL